jgi:hypothetical protein
MVHSIKYGGRIDVTCLPGKSDLADAIDQNDPSCLLQEVYCMDSDEEEMVRQQNRIEDMLVDDDDDQIYRGVSARYPNLSKYNKVVE